MFNAHVNPSMSTDPEVVGSGLTEDQPMAQYIGVKPESSVSERY